MGVVLHGRVWVCSERVCVGVWCMGVWACGDAIAVPRDNIESRGGVVVRDDKAVLGKGNLRDDEAHAGNLTIECAHAII